MKHHDTYITWGYVACYTLLAFYLTSPELQAAISVGELKVPMKELKEEVFSWLFAIKVAAAAVGGAFSLVQQSLTPFGVGAGIAAGIHFFDKYIGDGSTMLLDAVG